MKTDLYTETDTEVNINADNCTYLHYKNSPLASVGFGSPSSHADSLLQHMDNITEKYHYLKALADLDSA